MNVDIPYYVRYFGFNFLIVSNKRLAYMKMLRNDFWFIHEYLSTVFVCGFELQNNKLNWKSTGFIVDYLKEIY
jgi:hypothetical protein